MLLDGLIILGGMLAGGLLAGVLYWCCLQVGGEKIDFEDFPRLDLTRDVEMPDEVEER